MKLIILCFNNLLMGANVSKKKRRTKEIVKYY